MSTAVELGMVTIQLVKAMVQALESIARSLAALATARGPHCRTCCCAELSA